MNKGSPVNGEELLRMIRRSGISPAFVHEGYHSQSFSIYIKGPRKIKAHLSGANKLLPLCILPAKFRDTKPLDVIHCKEGLPFRWHALLWQFAVCFCLPWPGQIYHITASESFQSLLQPVKDSNYTTFFYNKVNLMQPDKTGTVNTCTPKAWGLKWVSGSYWF